MSALDHIRAYLKAHFAGHDTETLITHLETAIEAKIETAVAEVRQEIADLRADLMGGRPSDKPEPSLATADLAARPGDVTRVPGGLAIETMGAQGQAGPTEAFKEAFKESLNEGSAV